MPGSKLIDSDYPRVGIGLSLYTVLADDAVDDLTKCSMSRMRRSHWALTLCSRGMQEVESPQMTMMKKFGAKPKNDLAKNLMLILWSI